MRTFSFDSSRTSKYSDDFPRPAERVFEIVAKAYGNVQAQFAHKPDLFFSVVDIEDASEVFMENGIQQGLWSGLLYTVLE